MIAIFEALAFISCHPGLRKMTTGIAASNIMMTNFKAYLHDNLVYASGLVKF